MPILRLAELTQPKGHRQTVDGDVGAAEEQASPRVVAA